jgi:hypothetical protein
MKNQTSEKLEGREKSSLKSGTVWRACCLAGLLHACMHATLGGHFRPLLVYFALVQGCVKKGREVMTVWPK